jgi:hypothetical protein
MHFVYCKIHIILTLQIIFNINDEANKNRNDYHNHNLKSKYDLQQQANSITAIGKTQLSVTI